eukprot:65176-Prymnesium_polylepis.1
MSDVPRARRLGDRCRAATGAARHEKKDVALEDRAMPTRPRLNRSAPGPRASQRSHAPTTASTTPATMQASIEPRSHSALARP